MERRVGKVGPSTYYYFVNRKLLFEMARYYSPSTIFFDEIDAMVSKRDDSDGEANRK